MRQALIERLADGIDIVGNAAKDFAVSLLIKITQRQTVNFLGQLPAHSEGNYIFSVIEFFDSAFAFKLFLPSIASISSFVDNFA